MEQHLYSSLDAAREAVERACGRTAIARGSYQEGRWFLVDMDDRQVAIIRCGFGLRPFTIEILSKPKGDA